MPDLVKVLLATSCLALGAPAFAQAPTQGAETPAPETTTEPTAPDAVVTPAAPAAGLPAGETEAAAPEADASAAGTAATDGGEAAGTSGASDLSMGDAGEQPGQTYIQETFGDWEMRCIRTESGNDPCQLYQLLQDDAGNNVAEISLFGLPAGQQAAAGATIITPLETLLLEQISLSVDGGQAKRYPFSFCSTIGCFARIGFTNDEVNQLKRGRGATLTIVPVAAPDQKVVLSLSLSGFTAGYDAVNAANADN